MSGKLKNNVLLRLMELEEEEIIKTVRKTRFRRGRQD